MTATMRRKRPRPNRIPGRAAPRRESGIPKVNIVPPPDIPPSPDSKFMIEHYSDMCAVLADGHVIATGLTKAQAWALIERLEAASVEMEGRRLSRSP